MGKSPSIDKRQCTMSHVETLLTSAALDFQPASQNTRVPGRYHTPSVTLQQWGLIGIANATAVIHTASGTKQQNHQKQTLKLPVRTTANPKKTNKAFIFRNGMYWQWSRRIMPELQHVFMTDVVSGHVLFFYALLVSCVNTLVLVHTSFY